MKYIAGKLLDYDTFCQLHEDVLEWLLESEDKLKSMDSVSDNLDVARNQFEDNSEYMTELDIHQRAVGEVIKKGRHLLCTDLSEFQVNTINFCLNFRYSVKFVLFYRTETFEFVKNFLSIGKFEFLIFLSRWPDHYLNYSVTNVRNFWTLFWPEVAKFINFNFTGAVLYFFNISKMWPLIESYISINVIELFYKKCVWSPYIFLSHRIVIFFLFDSTDGKVFDNRLFHDKPHYMKNWWTCNVVRCKSWGLGWPILKIKYQGLCCTIYITLPRSVIVYIRPIKFHWNLVFD